MTPADPPSTTVFTARQIAKAIGASDRVLRRRLALVKESRVILDRGGECRAWTFDALPFAIQQQMEAARRSGGFSSIDELMTVAPLAPELPRLADCHPDDVADAVKLRAALERALASHDKPFMAGADLVAVGLADYRKTFSHAISERHWRRLFQRTLTRAGTSLDFTRLELYLPDRPRLRPGTVPAALTEDEDEGLAALRIEIRNFAEPLKLSRSDRELVWTRALEWFEERIAAGEPARTAKETLFTFLQIAAPSLARSRDSLRVLFNKRVRDPAALQDRRVAANEKRAKVVDSDEIARLVYTAVRKYRGRLAPALREVRGGQPGSRKSYVPETLSREARPMIDALLPFQQGPRAADKASPSMDLSYDGIRPMDCLVIDDATWNTYVKWQNPDGTWKLTRGQIILIIDFRTLRVLHFGIIPEEQPNSLLAYTVTTRAIAEFGVPKAIYLERGKVFAESKLMTGGKRTMQAMRLPGWQDVTASERSLGLQRLGIRIITARRARSKAVELVIGLLQNLTDGEVGYSGRNERFDRPESLTWLLKEAASKDPVRSAKAFAQFYTVEQWADRFAGHVATYNATPQEGKHLCGLSPDAGFQEWWPADDPPTKLDADSARWFMPHQQELEVRGGAVSFTQRTERFTYRHEALSRLEGRSVLAWFNPELPESIVITDLKKRHPVAIGRCDQPNALAVLTNPDDAVLASETAKIQRYQRHWAGIHRTLKAKFEPAFRHTVISPQVKRLGAVTRQAEERVQKQRRGEDHDDTRRQITLKIGRSPEELAPDVADYEREFREGLKELRQQARKEEGS